MHSVKAPFYSTVTSAVDYITAVLLHGRSICLPRGVKSCLRPVYLFQPSNLRPKSLRGGLRTAAAAAAGAAIFFAKIKFQKWPTMIN